MTTVDLKGKYLPPAPEQKSEPIIKPRLNDAQALLLILAGFALLAFLAGWILYEVPAAAHAETVRQRAVAAGNWRHVPGWQDYNQFTQNNK